MTRFADTSFWFGLSTAAMRGTACSHTWRSTTDRVVTTSYALMRRRRIHEASA